MKILRALALPLALAASGLYDEPLPASRPIREAQWKQMMAYADALPRRGWPKARDGSAMEALKARMGYPPPAFHSSVALRLSKIGEDGAAEYHRLYATVAPGLEAYGLYILPKRSRRPMPIVISQHGGGGFPEVAIFDGGRNYHDMIRGAVAAGYAVYAPLHIQRPNVERDTTPIPENAQQDLNTRLKPKGTILLAVEVARVTRVLDELLKRPEIDAARVGMIGLSYGGYATMITAAIEPRIRVLANSCSFRGTRDRGPAPRDPELIPFVLPRPLHIHAGLNDKTALVDDIRTAAAEARKVYHAAGSGEVFEYFEFDGVHEFKGELVWPWLRKHFGR